MPCPSLLGRFCAPPRWAVQAWDLSQGSIKFGAPHAPEFTLNKKLFTHEPYLVEFEAKYHEKPHAKTIASALMATSNSAAWTVVIRNQIDSKQKASNNRNMPDTLNIGTR